MRRTRFLFFASALVVGVIFLAVQVLIRDPDAKHGIGIALIWFTGWTLGRWEGWKRGREGREP